MFLNTKVLEKALDLKKDALFTVLRYFEKHSNKIKVFPTCAEKMILKSFKKSLDEVGKENEFVK